MTQLYTFGILMLMAGVVLEVSTFPSNSEFYRGAQWKHEGRWRGYEYRKPPDVYIYNGMDFQEAPLNLDDTTYTLFLRPIAYAKSFKGSAIANPISEVIIAKGRTGTIVHAPVATAVAGPGGIAHAQSDLYLYEYVSDATLVQYLPFYGGGKGQYLEVKKDTTGKITSEKIISEKNISSENIVKNNDGNLIAKVMAANLQNLKTLSTNLLKLTNIGRKAGTLEESEKTRFKTQLVSLGEAASNIIKLIEEVDDVDVLFRKNATLRKVATKDDEDYDYFAEEGVAIEAADDESVIESGLEQHTIAEAKPVGLAVIGENGLAASRPMATAVASSGVAIARPIATAIAGVDPAALGINFHINEYSRS